MADYQCSPLWEASVGLVGNIPLATLPLSQALVSALSEWASQYDRTLNMSDPMSSGFASKVAESEFMEQGHRLRAMLQTELGPDYVVSYTETPSF